MWDNNDSITINKNQGFVAFRFSTTSEDEPFKTQVLNGEVVSAQFFVPQRVSGSLFTFNSNYTYNTILCSELYQDQTPYSDELAAAVEGHWFCADTSDEQIELLNSAWYDNNKTLMLEANSCNSIYGDENNCVTAAETLSKLSMIQLETKIVGRYFDLSQVDNG